MVRERIFVRLVSESCVMTSVCERWFLSAVPVRERFVAKAVQVTPSVRPTTALGLSLSRDWLGRCRDLSSL